MKTNSKGKVWWVVTDIDGTLMDHNYDLKPALSTIKWLQELQIPIIPCTSKTASEVRALRLEIGLKDPFIVENGGAVYGVDESKSEEWQLVLGKNYEYLRSKLDLISLQLGYALKPLNDLSFQEIYELTGLKDNSIKLALKREWSVPFLNPPECDREKLNFIANKFDTTIYKGNRMSHLLSKGSHKGEAVLQLKRFLNQQEAKIIALGDSPNDLPLLQIADKAIVVPSKDGPNSCLQDGIRNGNFLLAPAPHSEGWALSIRDLLTKEIINEYEP